MKPKEPVVHTNFDKPERYCSRGIVSFAKNTLRIAAFLCTVTQASQPALPSIPVAAEPPKAPIVEIKDDWSVRTDKAAFDIAVRTVGVAFTQVQCAITLRIEHDDTLVSDAPVTPENPVWVVRTPELILELDSLPETGPVRTRPLSYDVAIRAVDGAVLRIQTPPLTLKANGARVESLTSTSYKQRLNGTCDVFHGMVVEPKSTLVQVLKSIHKAFGGPESAQQMVVHLWKWSQPECINKEPRNVWAVDLRTDASEGSQTGGMESRLPVGLRPIVSNLIHIVNDGSNEWLSGSNFPKPIVRGADGIIIDYGDSRSARSRPSDEKVAPGDRK